MSHDRERIVIEAPASELRRDRIEQQVFERLAAIRAGERAGAAMPASRARGRWVPWLAAAGAAAAVVLVILFAIDRDPAAAPSTPSSIATPVGGSSRFTVGDAIIDAGSDTRVEVTSGATGVALALARGSVDCDVAPRAGRPPFRVIAGDVAVEVVGTRFTVTRTSSGVRVDVARGKVRVTGPSGERFVTAGETWSSAPTITASAPAIEPTAGATEPAASDAIDPTAIDLAVDPTEPPRPGGPTRTLTSHALFDAAQRLRATDPAAAAGTFRKAADAGRDKWAAVALFELADLERSRGRALAAFASLDEYHRRFPRGANAEDASWLRVEALRDVQRVDAARAAASEYLRRFPSGTYVKLAQALVGTP